MDTKENWCHDVINLNWRHGCHADNRWTLYNLLIVPLLPIVRYDFDNLLEYDTGSLLDKSKIA